MRRFLGLATAVALLVPSIASAADVVSAEQARTVALRDGSAVVFFTNTNDKFEVVTTVASSEEAPALRFTHDLTAGLAGHEGVREVRRVGTMTGIEVEPVGERTGFAVCQAARRRGVWVRPLGDVVVLMPPLAIGDDDLQTLCGVVEDSIRGVVG